MIARRQIIHWVGRLPRGIKIAIMLGTDTVMILLALFTAMSLRLGSFDHLGTTGVWTYAAAVISSLSVFAALGLYQAIVRHAGTHTAMTIIVGVTISTIALALLDLMVQPRAVPLTALAIYWAHASIYVIGIRFVAVAVFRLGVHRPKENVIVYGAGKAGTQLAAMMRADSRFLPVAFVDDNPGLRSRRINGITVHPSMDLPDLITDYGIRRVLLAIPSASPQRRRDILTKLTGMGVRVKSVPELSEFISGRVRLDNLRDVDVTDLLGRDPVPPNPSLLHKCIQNKSVMVTGAGGSIGSELCRQIIALGPRRLVLFEMSELALYGIDRELRTMVAKRGLQVELVPLLGSVHDRQRIRNAIFSCGVQTIYHAAAYKHVPIVEHNVMEGLQNNVIGTWHTAESALDAGVETFVLISTDKAVNPANVMGASKRFAELILQGLQTRSSTTRFCMVRFGNVLASSGSVVPLFQEQIRSGGPVTVTHPEVIRYFMTIPEAAELVIQAGAMGSGGDVFVLDMGQPVRIDELARRMIQLMGRSVRDESNQTGEIEIKYTGLRTAEKLYEELLIGNNVTGTEHPRIMRALEHSLPWPRVEELLRDLLLALSNFDCPRALGRLADAVQEYNPPSDIHDHIWQHRAAIRLSPDPKIALIQPRRRTEESRRPGAAGDD